MSALPSLRFLCFLQWLGLLTISALLDNRFQACAAEGAEVIAYYGYNDCIRLSNDSVTAVLCPAAGGRVLEYSLDGTNVLYLPPGDEGWKWDGQSRQGPMNAGRFDIGPEKVVRRGQVLWMGAWTGEVTGDRSARLTSQFDPVSGVRLVRDFELAPDSSRLTCTQTIINESDQPVSLCHWSRTFAVGGGIAVVPRSPRGRFPKGYTMYGANREIFLEPEDPNITVSDEAVVIFGAPQFPKLGFDSHVDWLAYLAPTNQVFIKRFQVFPGRAYNEFAGLTSSVWYPKGEMVELEPIGPAEDLAPGQRASFSEQWWLLARPFPSDSATFDFPSLKDMVEKETEPPQTGGGNLISPEVAPDRRVTFRFAGGEASSVRVQVAGNSHPMSRDARGNWTFQTEPLPPGLHEYTFRVDGARVTDPRNRWIKKWLECASLFEIPGDPPLLTERQAVDHGTLHHHVYDSPAIGGQRSAVVYTPPGYSEKSADDYPLVLLCHGFGDDETAWTEVGRAHLIADNLIAAGKLEPLVIVMPNGHPLSPAQRQGFEDYNQSNSELMVKDIVETLLPLIEQAYRVTKSPDRRAVVGLSMGGGHAITLGLSHPELFASIGAFSSATPQGDLATRYPEWLSADRPARDRDRLFWIACGVDDFLLERNRRFSEALNQHQVRHTYLETQGDHSWPVWREYLPRFLERFAGREPH